jgi:hypothetical protein
MGNIYNRHDITIEGHPVRIYTDASNSRAIVFFCYGRYNVLSCRNNALDFTIGFLLNRYAGNDITFNNLNNTNEDTISLDKAAS